MTGSHKHGHGHDHRHAHRQSHTSERVELGFSHENAALESLEQGKVAPAKKPSAGIRKGLRKKS